MLAYVLLLLGAVFCAVQAMRTRLLPAALWLAGCSALVAVVLYLIGAAELAVIELSVGAGLVTIVLVFAVSMAEDEPLPRSLLPRPLAIALVVGAVGALGWIVLPDLTAVTPQVALVDSFVDQVWGFRRLDLLVQIAIVFAGVLGILGLLGEVEEPVESPDEQVEPEGVG